MSAERLRRVLVVDDDPSILRVLGALIPTCGSVVDLASDGTQAIGLLEERSYDLVISDLRMGAVDGLQVLAAAKNLHPRATRLLMSGTVEELAQAGKGDTLAQLLMRKPLDFKRLREFVQAVAADGVDEAPNPALKLEEFQRIYQLSTDVAFVKDTRGNYLHMNPAGIDVLKRPAREIIGHRDTEIFDEATLLEEVRASDQAVLRTGRPYVYANTTRTSGAAQTFLSVKLPVRDSAGGIVAIACLSRNVTNLLRVPPATRRRHARVLLRDVDGMMSVLTPGVPGQPIDLADVEQCLDLPARVPHRILVVERDGRFRTLAALLGAAGYDLVESRNLGDAWDLLVREGESIDAIVSGIPFPELRGRSIGESIGKRWPGIGVLSLAEAGTVAHPPSREAVSRTELLGVLASALKRLT